MEERKTTTEDQGATLFARQREKQVRGNWKKRKITNSRDRKKAVMRLQGVIRCGLRGGKKYSKIYINPEGRDGKGKKDGGLDDLR